MDSSLGTTFASGATFASRNFSTAPEASEVGGSKAPTESTLATGTPGASASLVTAKATRGSLLAPASLVAASLCSVGAVAARSTKAGATVGPLS